jgi:hypothetical protein
LQETSGYEGLLTGAIAQLHRDVDAVGDHTDVMPVAQVPRHIGGGSASAKCHRLVSVYQLSSGKPDLALLRGAMLLAILEQGVVAEGFVEQGLDQHRAAVGSPHQAFLLQFGQVAPHTRQRGAQRRDQLGERNAPLLAQFFQYLVCPVACLHFRGSLPAAGTDNLSESRLSGSFRKAGVYNKPIGGPEDRLSAQCMLRTSISPLHGGGHSFPLPESEHAK